MPGSGLAGATPIGASGDGCEGVSWTRYRPVGGVRLQWTGRYGHAGRRRRPLQSAARWGAAMNEPRRPDPRAKEAALERLRDAEDESLALFEHTLRDDAERAGASEHEIRAAQAKHPGHS